VSQYWTRTIWSFDFGERLLQRVPLHNLRLLLDQNFPKPPGFDVRSVDSSLDVQHLSDYDPALSAKSTPDWKLYWIAHKGGFDALVTRDAAQRTQLVEMYVLSKLPGFTIITWKRALEDPVTEWGQLIAYLPEIRKRFENDESLQRTGSIILLPKPKLSSDNVLSASGAFGELAIAQGVSNREARLQAQTELRDVIDISGWDFGEYTELF
jgi:hypothetical protein